MPTLDTARRLAAAWCDAWNRRDLAAVMAQYADNVAFCSPAVIERWGVADGWLRGRDRLRAHFAQAMQVPGLRFELIDVLVGTEQMCVLYRRESGILACNLVEFDAGGRIVRVIACTDQAQTPIFAAPVSGVVSPVGVTPPATVRVAAPDIREVAVQADLLAEPEAVWALLTRPDQIARWLLPSNFRPVVGHRFTFQAPPTAEWDGAIQCEVLEVEPLARLSYIWGIRGQQHERDTIVTWTLSAADEGTRLRLVHAGHHSSATEAAYAAMYPDWHEMFARIDRLAQ